MGNIFDLKDFSTSKIKSILDMAQFFCDGGITPTFSKKVACNLFFEPSTRTQYSFQVAQEKLGMKTITFSPFSSSLKKNESFYDTVKTFDSFGTDLLVIRHSKNEYYKALDEKISTPIINGGDGTGNHPTQSLLDLLTIQQEFGQLEDLSVVIVGDIAHSRVAHTNFDIMNRVGMHVYTSGPIEYSDSSMNFIPFSQILPECDVVMMLRMQYERHFQHHEFNPVEYNQKYGINHKSIAQMKSAAIIMHPGPVNRSVEILDDFVECKQSRIFKQINNGIFVRMAAIKYVLSGGIDDSFN
ncbi:MAG: aspartate carbamoyltransferase catalytic subunit [Oscillospiraceae bacterium]|jgi:aspartate carbamoyltransferase catalytic subunit|nr:aspartate carbamoyltransferase catalytic subunit [Oscillospiraceae bacterium]